MALPTKVKTWQIDTNNRIVSAAELPWYQALMFALKESLIGFASNPWTVVASSDGATANNAGTDLWVDSGDLVWSTGNHSWIVLENVSGSMLAIAFDISSTSNQDAQILFSPSGGFLAANGGTDGTIAARPTATDEFDAIAGTDALASWHNQVSAPIDSVFHVWHSNDGTVTYIAGFTSNVVHTFVALGSINNPVTGHTTPYLGSWVSSNGIAAITSMASLNDNQRMRSSQGGVVFNMYLTCPGAATSMVPEFVGSAVAEELSGELFFYETGMVCGSDVGYRGPKGSLYDVYWGQYQLAANGDTYPNNASTREWVQVGALVLPWTGDATIPETA